MVALKNQSAPVVDLFQLPSVGGRGALCCGCSYAARCEQLAATLDAHHVHVRQLSPSLHAWCDVSPVTACDWATVELQHDPDTLISAHTQHKILVFVAVSEADFALFSDADGPFVLTGLQTTLCVVSLNKKPSDLKTLLPV